MSGARLLASSRHALTRDFFPEAPAWGGADGVPESLRLRPIPLPSSADTSLPRDLELVLGRTQAGSGGRGPVPSCCTRTAAVAHPRPLAAPRCLRGPLHPRCAPAPAGSSTLRPRCPREEMGHWGRGGRAHRSHRHRPGAPCALCGQTAVPPCPVPSAGPNSGSFLSLSWGVAPNGGTQMVAGQGAESSGLRDPEKPALLRGLHKVWHALSTWVEGFTFSVRYRRSLGRGDQGTKVEKGAA